MSLIQTIVQNSNKPAPRWFRITKKMLSNTSTFVLAVLVVINKTDEKTMLIIKLCESFILEQLDTLLSNGTVYADISQVKNSEKQPVQEVKPLDQ